MKNVTITMEEAVARWARVRAAERNTSVSRMVGEMLADAMRRETRYQSAKRRYLARGPVVLSEPGATYPTRDAVHERSHLR